VQPEPESLAWGISTMIDDPVNAQVRGRLGRTKVDRQFLWEPIANRMTDTYARVGG